MIMCIAHLGSDDHEAVVRARWDSEDESWTLTGMQKPASMSGDEWETEVLRVTLMFMAHELRTLRTYEPVYPINWRMGLVEFTARSFPHVQMVRSVPESSLFDHS